MSAFVLGACAYGGRFRNVGVSPFAFMASPCLHACAVTERKRAMVTVKHREQVAPPGFRHEHRSIAVFGLGASAGADSIGDRVADADPDLIGARTRT